MPSERYCFDRFTLDPQNRQLTRDGEPVDVNSRYLDALMLLVRDHGQLVSKARFLEDVWRGAPVTDEALTQCIKTLRKHLGDRASSPRFIETVPKHGYRFIAPVELENSPPEPAERLPEPGKWRELAALGTVGTLGGGIAGIVGGLVYGVTAASQSSPGETGALSVVLVVLALTILIAVIGGSGVGFGVAAARVLVQRSPVSSMVGGALGGMVVGAAVELLGIDAFNLLFGQSPGDVTGAIEGLILGGAVGLGIGLATRESTDATVTRRIAGGAAIGAAAGCLIAFTGGRLMLGSLDLLVRQFSGSRLRVDPLGQLFGNAESGEISRLVTSGLEGALFAACIVGAVAIARRGYLSSA